LSLPDVVQALTSRQTFVDIAEASQVIVPGTFPIYFVIFLLVVGGLVFYALYKKGDVRAVFSHGKTVLELEAKERNQPRK
jgi:hypothetical protein